MIVNNKKISMDVLLFILLVNQMPYTFGKVTVLRGSVKTYKHPYDRKLICASEDDGSALVWNDNLIGEYYDVERQSDRQFRSLTEFNNNKIDYELDMTMYWKSWSKQNWSFTNSLNTPMGPVFDQRWEKFQEYENLHDRYDVIKLLTTNVTAVPLSIRAHHNAYILICNSNNYESDLCYWIIIGGWDNTLSIIRKCASGAPAFGTYLDGNCIDKVPFVKHSPLSLTEWRTFIITWNSATRNITVYDKTDIIMTYVDRDISSNSGGDYHVFIRSDKAMLARFHIYNFLHTTMQNATLKSPVFRSDNEKICMQLTIGLCAKCDAHIILRDITSDEVWQTVIVHGWSNSAVHDFPMWQSIKIEKNLLINAYNNFRIELIPKLNKPTSKPLWAIANFRQCPPDESLRFGVLNIKEDWTKKSKYFWPDVTCQKLSYDKYTTVSALPLVNHYIFIHLETDAADCPEGKIGPQCSFSCKYDLKSDADCEKVAICYENGCVCPPGFLGPFCSRSCNRGNYGYRCGERCGSCLGKTSVNTCNKITGACYDGCDYAKKISIPPLCQINMDQSPEIISTSYTTVEVSFPMILKNEYKEKGIFYSFIITGPMDYHFQHPWNMISRNTTQLIGYFDNLKSAFTYKISCVFNIENYKEVHSSWQSVVTKCDPIKEFDVMCDETSLVITWQNETNKLYSCPANQYYLLIKNIDTSRQIISETVMSFPYKLSNLTSYTTYHVLIHYKNNDLLSKEIRTLEGVPSKVLDLRKISTINNTQVLMWKPPNKPNGEIVRYEIILKIKQYRGCEDFNLSSPHNHITTKFISNITSATLDLHPYTSYSAQVTAYNSRYGSTSEEITFETEKSEIPTEVFSQLTVRDWKMSWSPPEDCRMISGPITVRIKIRGISDAVKDFNVTLQSMDYHLDLDKIKPPLTNVEQYIATIYVVRDFSSPENVSAYREYEFETPPIAPPKITSLEIVETDTRQSPAIIHLRWQSPFPPFNGKLRNYAIQSCDKSDGHCEIFEVQLNDFCDLWDNYICGNIQKSSENSKTIQVVAYNMNVTESSPPTLVTDEMLNNTTPEVPGDYTFLINNNSVVDLKWRHPWKTGDHLQSFYIRVVEISSNLTKQSNLTKLSQSPKIYEYPVTNYMPNYIKRLYLFPSTQYHIYIEAVTIANKSSSSKYVKVRTPANITFDGDVHVIIHEFNSIVKLNIPSVLNDTRDSIMHIIIKGPNPCEQYLKVPDDLRAKLYMNASDIAWQAAEISTSELAGKQFIIGDNKTYGNAINCPLKVKTLMLYEINIIVTGSNFLTHLNVFTTLVNIIDEPLIRHLMWVMPTFVIVVMAIIFNYIHRKKKKLRVHETNNKMFVKEEINEMSYSNISLSHIPRVT